MSEQLQISTKFSKPIVYGSISQSLGLNRKNGDKNTHRWCVYVRSPNNEDLSTFISKVVFILHETFPDHQRAITKPPFEVVEKGWGEFDIIIQIHFKAHYPQLEVIQKLKFYGAKAASNQQTLKKPLTSEFYDEIVFVNPSNEFADMLKIQRYLTENIAIEASESSRGGEDKMQIEDEGVLAGGDDEQMQQTKFDWRQHYLKFDALDHKQKLEDALMVIRLENERIRSETDKGDIEIEQLAAEVEALQKQYEASLLYRTEKPVATAGTVVAAVTEEPVPASALQTQHQSPVPNGYDSSVLKFSTDSAALTSNVFTAQNEEKQQQELKIEELESNRNNQDMLIVEDITAASENKSEKVEEGNAEEKILQVEEVETIQKVEEEVTAIKEEEVIPQVESVLVVEPASIFVDAAPSEEQS